MKKEISFISPDLDTLQESSDRLYAMLLTIVENERTEQTQMYIDTLIQVLKSLPTVKPLEFDLFN